MNIKESVIYKAFTQVNRMSSIVDCGDTFAKLPAIQRMHIKSGKISAHMIAKNRRKRS